MGCPRTEPKEQQSRRSQSTPARGPWSSLADCAEPYVALAPRSHSSRYSAEARCRHAGPRSACLHRELPALLHRLISVAPPPPATYKYSWMNSLRHWVLSASTLTASRTAAASCSFVLPRAFPHQSATMSSLAPNTSIYDFKPLNNKGEPVPMSAYKGKVLLIVNVASKSVQP